MTIDIQRTVNLDAPIVPETLRGALYQTEQMAHRFVITPKKGGATVNLTGAAISGLVMLADGQTKELLPSATTPQAGVTADGEAWVQFGAGCYLVPGRFGLTIYATEGGATTCIYACVGTISRTTDGSPTVPEGTIPTAAELAEMIAQVQDAIETIPTAVIYGSAQTLTDAQKTQARANIGAADAAEVSDLKSAFIASTGNGVIEYTLQNGYYPTSTVGVTVDFNTPTLSQNFESAIIECSEGDKFTVNGIGGSTGRLWAFLDADKKVVRRETNNYEITDKVITAESGEVWLVINNNKNTLPNAVSYYGVILLSRVEALENTQSTQNTAISALQALTTETANNLSVFTGNEEIKYTLQNGYYTTSTVGNTVDFNSPSSSNNFEAAIVECIPGDVFTINGIGGSNGRLWAFLDVDKKVVRRETLNTQISGKVITAQIGEVYLVINNNKTTVPDAVSYKGEVLTDKVSRIEETAMVAKTASGTETAFSELLEMGVYGLSKAQMSAMADKPSDVDDAVGTLINYSGAYLTGAYTIQRLYQLSGKAWERLVYTPTGEVSLAWERTDSSANVDNSNVLKGKKLVTAGDSYTQAYWDGDYAEYNGKNYGYYIAQRNGMTFVNSGISGSTMAVTKTGSGHNPFVVDRYTAVPEDTDYLILWFGINDAANCNLGTIDDEVNNTFYGAWNTVLRYYLTNRPWMKVLIIVTTGAIGWDGDTRLDFRQAIRNVAEKWGYPYLDWEKDKGIPAFFDREGMSTEARDLRRNAYGYNGPNTGHPNPQWYQYESTIIEAKLRSI